MAGTPAGFEQESCLARQTTHGGCTVVGQAHTDTDTDTRGWVKAPYNQQTATKSTGEGGRQERKDKETPQTIAKSGEGGGGALTTSWVKCAVM